MPQDTIISCAVCGRTLLQGEQPEIYLVNGSRRPVCELCTVRANHQGWIRESEGPQIGHRGSRDDRRPLLSRLRARRERRRMELDAALPEDGLPEPLAPEPPVAEPAPEPPRQEEALPVEAPREPRHVHAVPSSEDLKVARAIEVFNGSEHPRTVAGVARSLGVPSVAVIPAAGQASLVGITVAWELCWYRYEVDLADEGSHGIRPAGQGYELDELGEAEQVANAVADQHGLLAGAS